jgi:non-homologous end joining protein Ku
VALYPAEAIQAKGMVALARVVLTAQACGMLEPFSKGLLRMTLRYPYEVREGNAYFDEIPIGRFLAASSCNFKV